MTALTFDISGTSTVPFSRLVRMEWRKMVDTRAGFWLLLITGGLLALVFAVILLVTALASDVRTTATDWLNILTIPVAMLVPVLAITIVTQEWSQRTAMVTFALEPNRLRIVMAKLVAVLALGFATILLAFVLGMLGNVLGASIGGYDVTWNVTGRTLAWALVIQVLYLLMGFGFGLLLLSSPAAVAIYYVYVWILEGGVILPGIMFGLWLAFGWAQAIFPWISMRLSILPFALDSGDVHSLHDSGVELHTGAPGAARIVTSVLLWVGIPLVVGTWRMLRTEVK